MSSPNQKLPNADGPATPIKKRLRGNAATAAANARPSATAAPRAQPSPAAARRLSTTGLGSPPSLAEAAARARPSATAAPRSRLSVSGIQQEESLPAFTTTPPGNQLASAVATPPKTKNPFAAGHAGPGSSFPSTKKDDNVNRLIVNLPLPSSINNKNKSSSTPTKDKNSTSSSQDNLPLPAKPKAADYSPDRFAKQDSSGLLTLVTPLGRKYHRRIGPQESPHHSSVAKHNPFSAGDDDKMDTDETSTKTPSRRPTGSDNMQTGDAYPMPGNTQNRNGTPAQTGHLGGVQGAVNDPLQILARQPGNSFIHPAAGGMMMNQAQHQPGGSGGFPFNAPFQHPGGLPFDPQQQQQLPPSAFTFNAPVHNQLHQHQYPAAANFQANAQPKHQQHQQQNQPAANVAAAASGAGGVGGKAKKKALNVFTDDDGVVHTMPEGMNYSDDFEDWPETPFVSMEDFIKGLVERGEIDDLDRLYLMGVQTGIGLGIKHYKDTMISEYTVTGKLWSYDMEFHKLEDRTREQQGELVREIDAMEICAAMKAANEHILNRHNVEEAARELNIDLRPDLTQAKKMKKNNTAAPVPFGFSMPQTAAGSLRQGHRMADLSHMAGTQTVGGLHTNRVDGAAGAVGNKIMQDQNMQLHHQLMMPMAPPPPPPAAPSSGPAPANNPSLDAVFDFQAGASAGPTTYQLGVAAHAADQAARDAYRANVRPLPVYGDDVVVANPWGAQPPTRTPSLSETTGGRAVIQMPEEADKKEKKKQKRKEKKQQKQQNKQK